MGNLPGVYTVLVHQHFSPYIFYGEYQTSEAYSAPEQEIQLCQFLYKVL